MKILIYSGGLGNQMFCYAFTEYVRSLYGTGGIFGYYPHFMLNEHYGLEVDRWFDINLPKSNFIVRVILLCIYFLKKVFRIESFVDNNLHCYSNKSAMVIYAMKLNKQYIHVWKTISFKLKESDLSSPNQEILNLIKATNSVFVHVRRGDYLKGNNAQIYGGICEKEYYEKAFTIITSQIESPVFFFFSDDMEWVKTNFLFPNKHVYYVNWNKGIDSPIDMYLMSKCKGAITANSTFSYWGAYLGKEKIVVCPKKWINIDNSPTDIIPDTWISI